MIYKTLKLLRNLLFDAIAMLVDATSQLVGRSMLFLPLFILVMGIAFPMLFYIHRKREKGEPIDYSW